MLGRKLATSGVVVQLDLEDVNDIQQARKVRRDAIKTASRFEYSGSEYSDIQNIDSLLDALTLTKREETEREETEREETPDVPDVRLPIMDYTNPYFLITQYVPTYAQQTEDKTIFKKSRDNDVLFFIKNSSMRLKQNQKAIYENMNIVIDTLINKLNCNIGVIWAAIENKDIKTLDEIKTNILNIVETQMTDIVKEIINTHSTMFLQIHDNRIQTLYLVAAAIVQILTKACNLKFESGHKYDYDVFSDTEHELNKILLTFELCNDRTKQHVPFCKSIHKLIFEIIERILQQAPICIPRYYIYNDFCYIITILTNVISIRMAVANKDPPRDPKMFIHILMSYAYLIITYVNSNVNSKEARDNNGEDEAGYYYYLDKYDTKIHNTPIVDSNNNMGGCFKICYQKTSNKLYIRYASADGFVKLLLLLNNPHTPQVYAQLITKIQAIIDTYNKRGIVLFDKYIMRLISFCNMLTCHVFTDIERLQRLYKYADYALKLLDLKLIDSMTPEDNNVLEKMFVTIWMFNSNDSVGYWSTKLPTNDESRPDVIILPSDPLNNHNTEDLYFYYDYKGYTEVHIQNKLYLILFRANLSVKSQSDIIEWIRKQTPRKDQSRMFEGVTCNTICSHHDGYEIITINSLNRNVFKSDYAYLDNTVYTSYRENLRHFKQIYNDCYLDTLMHGMLNGLMVDLLCKDNGQEIPILDLFHINDLFYGIPFAVVTRSVDMIYNYFAIQSNMLLARLNNVKEHKFNVPETNSLAWKDVVNFTVMSVEEDFLKEWLHPKKMHLKLPPYYIQKLVCTCRKFCSMVAQYIVNDEGSKTNTDSDKLNTLIETYTERVHNKHFSPRTLACVSKAAYTTRPTINHIYGILIGSVSYCCNRFFENYMEVMSTSVILNVLLTYMEFIEYFTPCGRSEKGSIDIITDHFVMPRTYAHTGYTPQLGPKAEPEGREAYIASIEDNVDKQQISSLFGIYYHVFAPWLADDIERNGFVDVYKMLFFLTSVSPAICQHRENAVDPSEVDSIVYCVNRIMNVDDLFENVLEYLQEIVSIAVYTKYVNFEIAINYIKSILCYNIAHNPSGLPVSYLLDKNQIDKMTIKTNINRDGWSTTQWLDNSYRYSDSKLKINSLTNNPVLLYFGHNFYTDTSTSINNNYYQTLFITGLQKDADWLDQEIENGAFDVLVGLLDHSEFSSVFTNIIDGIIHILPSTVKAKADTQPHRSVESEDRLDRQQQCILDFFKLYLTGSLKRALECVNEYFRFVLLFEEYSIECVLFLYIVLNIFDIFNYDEVWSITLYVKNLLYRYSKINMVRYSNGQFSTEYSKYFTLTNRKLDHLIILLKFYINNLVFV